MVTGTYEPNRPLLGTWTCYRIHCLYQAFLTCVGTRGGLPPTDHLSLITGLLTFLGRLGAKEKIYQRQHPSINPSSPGGTYMIHKKPIFLFIPRLQGLKLLSKTALLGRIHPIRCCVHRPDGTNTSHMPFRG